MSWRVVVVTKKCKLECKLGYLVCRGEETKKVFISEISSIIIESTAVSITAALMCELVKAKVNIVFCDEKHNPCFQLNALYGRHDCSGQLRRQISWNSDTVKIVWTEIVRNKISKQLAFLLELQSKKSALLEKYILELQLNDSTNREGLAAKVYFDELFGLNFKRGDANFFNSALNYGYSILLSAVNRAVIACGYNTQIGINHKNEFNPFNLSCDLMEPLRIIVDRFILKSDEGELSVDYKRRLANILNTEVVCNKQKIYLIDYIERYIKSVFAALENADCKLIMDYEL